MLILHQKPTITCFLLIQVDTAEIDDDLPTVYFQK